MTCAKHQSSNSRQLPTTSEAKPRKLQKPTNLETPRESSQPVRAAFIRLLLSGMLRYVIFVHEEVRAQLLLANAKCNKISSLCHPTGEYMDSSTQELHLCHLFVAFLFFPL